MTTEIDRTIELSVDGMTCGHCVMSVSEELSEIPGVKNVDVSVASCALLMVRPGSTLRGLASATRGEVAR